MIALTALIFGSAGAWAKSEWRDATRHEKMWIVGLVVCAVGASVVGLLRVLGVF